MQLSDLLARLRRLADPLTVGRKRLLLLREVPPSLSHAWQQYRQILERSGQIQPVDSGWLVGTWEPRIVRKPLEAGPGATLEDFLARYGPGQLIVIRQALNEIEEIHHGQSEGFIRATLLKQLACWSEYGAEVVAASLRIWLSRRRHDPTLREAYLWGILRREACSASDNAAQESGGLSDKQRQELCTVLSNFYEQNPDLDWETLAYRAVEIENAYVARAVRQGKGLALQAKGGRAKRQAPDQS